MKSKLLFSILLCSSILTALCQDATALRKKEFNLESGVAISGYDPVAYFKLGKAVKGSKDFSVYADGVTYYLSSAGNKEEFKKNYTRYEPQYGGWCAYAMGSDGTKVDVDPETFKIIDGKLFLFYNRLFNNTLKSWNKNESQLKTNADVNWKKIYH